MTRGRKPATPVDVLEPEIDQERFAEAMDAMRTDESTAQLVVSQHQAAVRAMALQVGYQLPADCTDPDIIQRDIAANMRRSVEACLEVGRGLAVLRQACEHGQFLARLEALGIETRVAQRFMQSAVKFSNASTSTHFAKAIGSPSKLFELLVLDDDQAEELTLTGQTGELKLDDIASMSVKELRAALREAREEEKAKAELLSEKNRLLDAERAKSRRLATIPPDEALAALRKEVAAVANDARGAIVGQLRAGLVALQNHHDERTDGDSVLWAAGVLGQLTKDIATLRDEFGIPDVSTADIPEWVQS
ncbi:MAG: hypothetical protein LWW92_01065 [Rhodocyclales bacterium]|nr:hypothetical protein [Rhodocyclales bacterium]